MLLSLTLLFCLTTVSASSGDTIYVNTVGNDSWDGQSATQISGTTTGPKLSIKNATGTVNTNGTIHIANGQYTGENNTNITIDKNMKIIGESQTGTIINGTGTNWIFNITAGVNFTVQNLTLTNATAVKGGAIYNQGNLTATNCTFTSNTATSSSVYGGGAIYNKGTITNLSGCTFTNNKAAKYGGAVYNDATITSLSDCNFNGNIASGYGGGAIFNYGTLTATDSAFTGNNAYNGGAINNQGNLTATNCNFTGNNAPIGGAIDNWCNTTMTGCTFMYNTADSGGAISNDHGTLIAENCTFKGNTATSDGGAISNDGTMNPVTTTLKNCTFTGNTATDEGGAIYSIVDMGSATINLMECSFQSNVADNGGGAISNKGNLTAVNCNFINNTVTRSGNGDGRGGGAIYNYFGTITLNNCTFTGNTAKGDYSISSDIPNTYHAYKKRGGDYSMGGAILNGRSTIGNVCGCTFIGNTAGIYGGAISNWGSLTANYNRFYNNTATYGNAIYCLFGSSADANYNWWGSNKDPKSIDNLICDPNKLMNTTNWIILSVNTPPNSIDHAQNTTITADLNHYTNSTGYVRELSNHIPDGQITLSIPWGSFTNSGITHTTTLNTVNNAVSAVFYANEGAVNTSYDPVKVTASADGYTTNNTESAYITINKITKLYLKTTSSSNNPKVGETFLLTYKLGNYGPDAAENVTITFQLPEGLDFVNIHVDNGKCTYNKTTRTVTWTLNSVPVGDPYLYLTVKAATAGNYKITPNITSDTYNLNSGDDGIITFNVQPNSNENTVNAASKTTIGLQKTGLPLNYLILAILMVLSGLIPKRK